VGQNSASFGGWREGNGFPVEPAPHSVHISSCSVQHAKLLSPFQDQEHLLQDHSAMASLGFKP
jgi:hypothetical protein